MAASPEPELNLLEYFGTCVFDKFFITEGRARRKEIWGFMLFATLIYFVLLFLVAVGIIPEGVTYFYALIVFLPNLAVSIRRLHDLGFRVVATCWFNPFRWIARCHPTAF